jgi:hypothetical protein
LIFSKENYMTDLIPCPWCESGGTPFGCINRHPFFSVTIKCHTCHAEGPHVKFTPDANKWDTVVDVAKEQAKLRWNALYEKTGIR